MLVNRIIEAAKPYTAGKTIRDIVVGISLLAVELDNGDIGVSYVLREDLPGGCSAFPYAREAVGDPAEEIIVWAASGGDNLQRAIGNAALNAVAAEQELVDLPETAGPFGLEVMHGAKVGMIGMIPPVMMMLKPYDCEFIVFDKGREGEPGIYPFEREKELLAECDIVFISGTATINGTIDELLEWCSEKCSIVMLGSSTPMLPQAFKGSNVSVLAGSSWERSGKEDLFRLIAMASGIDGIRQYMIKKNVRVE